MEVILIRTPDTRTPYPNWPDQAWRRSSLSECSCNAVLLGASWCDINVGLVSTYIIMSNTCRTDVFSFFNCSKTEEQQLCQFRYQYVFKDQIFWTRSVRPLNFPSEIARRKSAAMTGSARLHLVIWSLFWLQRHPTVTLRLTTETVYRQNS